jgi:hypothetical protein
MIATEEGAVAQRLVATEAGAEYTLAAAVPEEEEEVEAEDEAEA